MEFLRVQATEYAIKTLEDHVKAACAGKERMTKEDIVTTYQEVAYKLRARPVLDKDEVLVRTADAPVEMPLYDPASMILMETISDVLAKAR